MGLTVDLISNFRAPTVVEQGATLPIGPIENYKTHPRLKKQGEHLGRTIDIYEPGH